MPTQYHVLSPRNQAKQTSSQVSTSPLHISHPPTSLFTSSMEDTKPPKPNLEQQEEPEVQGELDELETQISSPARTKSLISSPEFEFCMLRNPSFPQPQILFADELIADGVLVPLDLVSQLPDSDLKEKEQKEEKEEKEVLTKDPTPAVRSAPESSTSTSSKRWTDIFKINTNDKKTCASIAEGEAAEDKVKKKNRKSSVGGGNGSGSSSGVISAAELNINIWPFSRSWSGGNNRSKPGGGVGSRKVSSAPCSRSNSAGESKSRNRPNSPRPGGGIYLGRNSPVWQQVRRKDVATECRKNKTKTATTTTTTTTGGGGSDVGVGGGGAGAGKSKGLNLSVPMCMGYRQQLSCRREDNILVDAAGGGVGGAGEGNKFFHLRTLFTKKVH